MNKPKLIIVTPDHSKAALYSLGPVYELVCISFRTGNLNCFWGKMTMTNNMACVPKDESGTKCPKMTTPQ